MIYACNTESGKREHMYNLWPIFGDEETLPDVPSFAATSPEFIEKIKSIHLKQPKIYEDNG